jgi:rRNA-processing protein FCF1
VSTIYIVVDTNILLHQFDVMVQFVSDIERQGLPVAIVVPGVVIYELDG